MYFSPTAVQLSQHHLLKNTIPDLLNYFGACTNQFTIYKHGSISGVSVLFNLFVDLYTNVTLFQSLYLIADFFFF